MRLRQYGYGVRYIDRKNTCSREQLRKCDTSISPHNFPDMADIPPKF